MMLAKSLTIALTTTKSFEFLVPLTGQLFFGDLTQSMDNSHLMLCGVDDGPCFLAHILKIKSCIKKIEEKNFFNSNTIKIKSDLFTTITFDGDSAFKGNTSSTTHFGKTLDRKYNGNK